MTNTVKLLRLSKTIRLPVAIGIALLAAIIGLFAVGCDIDPSSDSTPALSGTVSIDGFPAIGKTVTVNTQGLNAASGFSYRWEKSANETSGFSNIGGATEADYQIDGGDVSEGEYLRVVVTAANYTGSITGNPVKVRAEDAEPDPIEITITGISAAHNGKTAKVNILNVISFAAPGISAYGEAVIAGEELVVTLLDPQGGADWYGAGDFWITLAVDTLTFVYTNGKNLNTTNLSANARYKISGESSEIPFNLFKQHIVSGGGGGGGGGYFPGFFDHKKRRARVEIFSNQERTEYVAGGDGLIDDDGNLEPILVDWNRKPWIPGILPVYVEVTIYPDDNAPPGTLPEFHSHPTPLTPVGGVLPPAHFDDFVPEGSLGGGGGRTWLRSPVITSVVNDPGFIPTARNIYITFAPVPGAASYVVRFSNTNTIGYSGTLSYQTAPWGHDDLTHWAAVRETSYWYKVVAHSTLNCQNIDHANGAGGCIISNIDGAIPVLSAMVNLAQPVVSGVTVIDDGDFWNHHFHKHIVNFSAVDGATGYRVFLSETEYGDFNIPTSIDMYGPLPYGDERLHHDATSPGVTYYYKVVAYDNQGNKSRIDQAEAVSATHNCSP